MKVFTEHRMFTQTEQIACVQPNETHDGVVLITQEVSPSDHSKTRLYLTIEEANELVFMLKSMVHKITNT